MGRSSLGSRKWCCYRRQFWLIATAVIVSFFLGSLLLIYLNLHVVNHQQTPTPSFRNQQQEYVNNKGVHVIVAHYYDNKEQPPTFNLTSDLANRNDYAPLPGEGENGSAVQLPNFLFSRANVLFHFNKFNLMVSDRISVNRTLPDARKPQCAELQYDEANLPSCSVVIIFHNEAWSTLLRTVHSVINRSPIHLLHEIILVDDASNRTFLRQPLDDYIRKLLVPVHVIHLPNRSGLIRARLKGAAMATGKILLFLDSHCECTTGWLQPLLARIAENRTHVVCPIIDVIDDENFSYVKSFDIHWGALNWALHFRWLPAGDDVLKQRISNITSPFRTPVMAGGLFAIARDYFHEIGAYDHEMNIWGGENIEISFRIWMCGGSLEIVPCSRVGHVFRKASPYNFPGGVSKILHHNLARVAETWLDEWKEFYYILNPGSNKVRDSVNVTSRIALRNELKCHDFRWYLENIWPQHVFPTAIDFFGKIVSKSTKKCLQKPSSVNSVITGKAIIHTCVHGIYTSQLFVHSAEGYIMTDESICLTVPSPTNRHPSVLFMACVHSANQQWRYEIDKEQLFHVTSGLCLDLNATPPHSLMLTKCSPVPTQKWSRESIQWA